MKLFFLFLVGLGLLQFNQYAQKRAQENPGQEKEALFVRPEINHPIIGENYLGLQWISWDKFGTTVVKRNGEGDLEIQGKQELRGDFIKIEGLVEIINQDEFIVKGKITTKVDHINSDVCTREGNLHFKKTQGKKYYRLQDKKNPCHNVTDYIDIFVKNS